MDLVSIRNLFLQEMQAFLIALDWETTEQLNLRKQRIREIDHILEEKKIQARQSRELMNLDDSISSSDN
jgi:hypothetical protein